MEARGALSHFEQYFQKHLLTQLAHIHHWSNRKELQRKRNRQVASDSALKCSLGPLGHIPSLGLVSNYDKEVGQKGLGKFLPIFIL